MGKVLLYFQYFYAEFRLCTKSAIVTTLMNLYKFKLLFIYGGLRSYFAEREREIEKERQRETGKESFYLCLSMTDFFASVWKWEAPTPGSSNLLNMGAQISLKRESSQL